ncbi:MAG: hypothetical protein U1F65_09290 [Verrucomicrobiota bacterium]
MKIGRPEIRQLNGETTYSVRVESSEGAQTLWYRVENEYAEFLATASDAPLLALLIFAMTLGEDIHLDGEVSERLWFNLAGPYQRLLRQTIPALRPVKIIPSGIYAPARRGKAVVTGFSLGVDSYCVLADHHYAAAPVGFRLTHLLYNNVGSHGKGGERLFLERCENVRPVAARIGLPLIRVNSNLAAFYQTKHSFQQTHTPRNASVPLLLQQGVGTFLYAASYQFLDCTFGSTPDIGRSDNGALPLFSTPTVEMHSAGSEYTRVEKTIRISDLPDTHSSLDVCVGNERGGNCSQCRKCLKTMFTLEVAGRLDRYSRVFDLELYRKKRDAFLPTILVGKHPLQKEIARFARKQQFPIPWPVWIRAWLFRPQEER